MTAFTEELSRWLSATTHLGKATEVRQFERQEEHKVAPTVHSTKEVHPVNAELVNFS